MEWLKQLNASINYIEEHLTDTIDMDKVSQIPCGDSSVRVHKAKKNDPCGLGFTKRK
ncbi:hypothetical protein CLHUN_38440 [Ruminiclostridium hungatei]|uniref:Uncharacterized protein n=1 Tax=Ruminiclostridium hungatei TaxID=48256 RepID=A0A1V4SF09_RUMHU|nr:hypothetical protein CLHUN_38440 [Ruminiclostridium hungatei]